jgi:hypothetical protein
MRPTLGAGQNDHEAVRAGHERFSAARGNPSLLSLGLTRAASPGLLAAMTYA